MNTKKWLALLTALMMLSACAAAFADSPGEMVNKAYEDGRYIVTTIKMLPGEVDMGEYNNMIASVLGAVQAQTVVQKTDTGSSARFDICQGNTVIERIDSVAKDGNLYFYSSALGNDVLYFTPADLGGLFLRLIDLSITVNPSANAEAQLSTMAALTEKLVKGTYTNTGNFNEYMDAIESVYGIDHIIQLCEDAADTYEVTNGAFESNDHDPAVTQIKMQLSSEDIGDVYQALAHKLWADPRSAPLLHNIYTYVLALTGKTEPISDIITPGIDGNIEVIQQALADYAPMELTCMLDKNNTLVSANMVLTNTSSNGYHVACRYLGQTKGEGRMHNLHMYIHNDITQMADNTTIQYLEGASNRDEISMHSDGSTHGEIHTRIQFSYQCDKEYDANKAAHEQVISILLDDYGEGFAYTLHNNTIAAYEGDDVARDTKMIVYPMNDTTPMLTLLFNTVSMEGEPIIVPAVQDTLRLGSMTDSELEAWLSRSQPSELY